MAIFECSGGNTGNEMGDMDLSAGRDLCENSHKGMKNNGHFISV
jgi:hypothetical protein